SLALDFDGRVWAWGANSYGQAGVKVDDTAHGLSSNNIRFYCETPVQLNLVDIQSISAGGFSSMALDDAGYIWNWGNNSWGQLGQNDKSSRYIPVKVKGVGGSGFLGDIILISAGYSHSLAFASGIGVTNTLYAWGSNYLGQLGDGTTTERWTPIVTATLPTAVGGGGFPSGGSILISAGLTNSIFKNPGGTITAFGSGFGTLEYIGIKYGNSPVLLDTIHDATVISAGTICLVLGPSRSASSVTIQSSGDSSSGGEDITFTASVSGNPGYPVTGNVDFYLNNGIGSLPAAKNSDGTYSYTIPWEWFAPGMNNKIVAVYSGDYNHLPSTSNDYWQFVGKLDSTTVLASTPNPSDEGETVTFSVTVSGPAGKPIPSGDITFNNGLFGSFSLDTEGKVEFTSSALSVGTTSITANYSGDSKYNSSSSSPVDHVVTPPVIKPGTQVIIDQAGWIDSGIDLIPGDVVDITATGVMTFYDPSGFYFDVTPAGQSTYEPGFSIDGSLSWISLIGRLDGNHFEIGTGLNFTANSPGRLYLAANNTDDYPYDSGSWDVQIVVTPASTGAGQLREYSMINGRDMWTDSGVDIQAGDEVALNASGFIYFSNQGWFLGPDGTGYTDPSALIDANLDLNSLVGCIGDPASSDIFYIGKSYTFQSSLSGRLWLGVNAAGFDNKYSSWDVNIDINITPYAITPDSLPDGMEGVAYGPVSLGISGGSGDFSWNWTSTSGQTPSGLNLNSNGVIDGTPGNFGIYYVTLQALENTSQQVISKDFTITIKPRVRVTTLWLPNGTNETAYSETLQAVHGKPPYTWSIFDGALPSGVFLTGNTIGGTPD
ncbi:MAG TPA: Ig-like domain repeat protein, partial [Dehalococcoidales bacterium]|nr:Ig-like domain repeat protein [Dehalococcoidales bacterium]